MFSKIEELKRVKKERERIEAEEKVISAPFLRDLSFIPPGTVISISCADIMFLYERYRDFREETDEVYRVIAERLKYVS
jgi:hypothetical protein